MARKKKEEVAAEEKIEATKAKTRRASKKVSKDAKEIVEDVKEVIESAEEVVEETVEEVIEDVKDVISDAEETFTDIVGEFGEWVESVGRRLIRSGASNKKYAAKALAAAGKEDKAKELQKKIEEKGLNKNSAPSEEIAKLISEL